ncbi:hypothetical protein J1614_007195 [Plenodomus biglobosus]|nr:hypothetical protein J1614_007195 [Plenodomus biglobosus]
MLLTDSRANIHRRDSNERPVRQGNALCQDVLIPTIERPPPPTIRPPEPKSGANEVKKRGGRPLLPRTARAVTMVLRVDTDVYKDISDLPEATAARLKDSLIPDSNSPDERQRLHAKFLLPTLEAKHIKEKKCLMSFQLKTQSKPSFRHGEHHACDTCHHSTYRICARLEKLVPATDAVLVIHPKARVSGVTWMDERLWI